MATGKVIGQIQVTQGNIKVVGIDGVVRKPGYEGYVYENEQVISNDPNALFQIKFLALPEASAYDGIFRILADGSVIHGRDAMDSMMSDENLVKVLEATAVKEGAPEDLETAAGEEGAEGSSSFTETDIVAESSVLGFSRGANSALGFGITDFGSVPNYDAGQITPPAITSPNVVIYDENGTEPVIQITATAEGTVTYGIGGLDSDLFNIDSATGLVTFKESPDFENPRDSGGDNEYNTYVTVTDSFGNYTTQLLSVSINNLNEAVTAFDDTVDAVEDTILSSTIDLDANDTDLDGNPLSVAAGTYTTAQGGTIVIAADGSYTYTPALNFNGTDTVNYTVTDGEFSDVGTLTINVAPINDKTIINNDTATTAEETPVTINVLANDTDIDGAKSAVASVSDAANGTVTINTDGTVTYTPNANFNGSDSFIYTNTEGNSATVSVIVNPINDLTAIVGDSAVTNEDIPVIINVLANDTDSDSSVSPVANVTQGSYGTVTINTDGTLTYAPNVNYNGTDSFTYTNAEGNTAAVSVTVNPANDNPIAVDDANSLSEDASATVINVLANDTDLDSDTLVVTGVTQPENGVVTLIEGVVSYIPDENYNGTDSFTYTISDGNGGTDTAVVNLTIDSVNDNPVAVDDYHSLSEDASATVIDVLANDTDLSGDTLTVTGVTQPENGVVTLIEGVVSYIPDENYNGTDSFTYTISDGNGGTDTAVVNLTIDSVNDNPVAVDDYHSLSEDASATVINVLANDTDLSGDTLTVTGVTQPENGVVTLIEGVVSYIPDENYNGTDSFTYTISDGNGGTDTAVVNLSIDSVNDSPVAVVDSGTAAEDGSVVINVVANDTDLDGTIDPTTVTIITDPTNGTVIVNPTTGAITYTPDADYVGPDSFSYTVQDNSGATSSPAIVSLSVTPVASAPIVTIIPDLNPDIVQDYENETFTNYDWQINSGSSTGILEFDGYARSVSMNIKSFNGNPGFDTGIVELLRDGVVVETYSLNDFLTTNPGASAKIPLTFTSDAYFNEVRVNNTSVSGDVNNEFKILNVMLVSPYLVTYSVEASAVLTDTNETLSNLILRVPSSLGGVLVVDGFAPTAILSADSEYNYYSIPAENGGVELIFDFSDEPTETELGLIESAIDSISGSATSWESGDGFALSATSDADMIVGTLGDDSISGEDGNDVIFGGAGADDVDGDAGNDTLAGEEGNDTIDGGAGADSIYGGAGNDTIVYDGADIEIDGGEESDVLIANSGVVDLSNVSNIEVIQLNSGATVVGSDTLLGINATDVINATDADNMLIIQSADDNSYEISVNTDSLVLQAESVNIDGIDYAQYVGGGATLLIEIDDTIDVV